MRARGALSLALAAAACAIGLGYILNGIGHPYFLLVLAAGAFAAIAIRLGQPILALAAGVAMGVVGALSAAGGLGVLLALLVAASGAMIMRGRALLVVGALVAAALPGLLVEALHASALASWSGRGKILAPPAWAVYASTGAPAAAAACVILALVSRRGRG